MIVNLIWLCGGVFLGYYLGNATFRAKVNEAVGKLGKKKDDTKGKGKKS